MKRIVLLLLIPFVMGAAQGGEAPLGRRENPVRCSMPRGERDYLMRLRCSGGEPVEFKRGGSVGPGPHGNILDRYEVRCPGHPDTTSIFMDMYHRGYREMKPVPGFTLLPEFPALLATGCPPRVPGTITGEYVFNEFEVERTPRPLVEIPDKVKVGTAGRAYVELVISAQGLVDLERTRFLYLSEESVHSHATAFFRALKFAPAEHHAGCAVPFRAEIGINFE